MIVIGQELDAARALVGTYRVEDGALEVMAKVIDLEKGAIVGVVEDHGRLDDLLELENQLAKNLLRLEGDALPAAFDSSSARRRAIPLEAHREHAQARRSADPAERRSLLESALERHPRYVEAQLLLGQELLKADHALEAIEVLSSVEPESVFYREAYFMLGLAYLAVDEPEGAVEIFSNLAAQKDEAVLHNNLGVARLRGEKREEAIEAFQKAAELDPTESDYLFNLGWSAWRAGKGSEALRWLREAVHQDPRDGEARLFLSAAAASQALPEEAEEERELALVLNPSLADIDASTVEGLERIVEGVPRPARESSRLGGAAGAVGERLEEARDHRAAGRRQEAVQTLQRALHLDPHSEAARVELADIYLEEGELGKAVGELRVALWDNESAENHLRLARIYEEMGELRKALAHAQKAVEMDPEHEGARQMLERLQTNGSP
ncbi:MAG: tetratricopeptide repeat protein [Acidobacteriota bacterium]